MNREYILSLLDLHVSAGTTPILKGVSLNFEKNRVHAIVGPNGSGKSTIAKAIMGFPDYKITQGDILYNGQSILNKTITERARMGIALAFQNPPVIKGVKLDKFICMICQNCRGLTENRSGKHLGVVDKCSPDLSDGFRKLLIENLKDRDINDGFSGGEIRRSELFQVISLKPEVMILDEPDSGLDYDSLKLVGRELKEIRDAGKTTMIIITHSRYILEYLEADRVFIIDKGKKVFDGDKSILPQLEELGYREFLNRNIS
ncbi:MAG: Fe-S cluster assembly ATPase SufC [Candidatus Odinarchaeota archaeon]